MLQQYDTDDADFAYSVPSGDQILDPDVGYLCEDDADILSLLVRASVRTIETIEP